ncbi:MAG: tetratricopeptide repeat protein, partial [Shewanella sp.]
MSVINKMLQDLDKRQQGHSLSNITLNQAQYLGRTSSSRKWLVICLLSVLVGGLSMYAFQSSYRSQQTMSIPSNIVATPSAHQLESSSQSSVPIEATTNTASITTTTEIGQTKPQQSTSTQASDKLEISGAQPSPTDKATLEATSQSVPVQAKESSTPVSAVNPPSANVVQAQARDTNRPIDSAKAYQMEPNATVSNQTAQVALEPNQARANQQAEFTSVQPKAAGQMAVKEVKLSPSQLAQKQAALASDAEKQGQLLKAMGYYDKALKLDPSLHEARKQLAALHYGQGELAQAAEVLSQGRLLYPQEYEFYLLLARIQHAMGDTDSALASLAQIPDRHVLARQKWLAQTDLAQKQG